MKELIVSLLLAIVFMAGVIAAGFSLVYWEERSSRAEWEALVRQAREIAAVEYAVIETPTNHSVLLRTADGRELRIPEYSLGDWAGVLDAGDRLHFEFQEDIGRNYSRLWLDAGRMRGPVVFLKVKGVKFSQSYKQKNAHTSLATAPGL